MSDFLNFISEILWGSVMIYLLLGAGVWFTLRTGVIQFRYLRFIGITLKKHATSQPGNLTSLQALCTSLAARVGSGNLVGVAIALTSGGPGALFWMWVSGITGMALSFAECSLAQLYKRRDGQGRFHGGPAWYMEHALGMRWMGVLFSLFLLVAFGLVFNAVQANAIALALHQAFALPRPLTGLLLMGATLLVILRGLQGVARFAQWMVPLVAGLWVLTALVVMVLNVQRLPEIVALIVKSAFGWHELASGTLAYTISQALTSGFQRGMFTNEAGMGSSPNVAAAAESWPPHPATQGIVQMLGVFIDTLVICSATAFILLLSGVNGTVDSPAAGIMLTQRALSALAGHWASGYVALILTLFAFNAIVANYSYAENNLWFLRQHHASRRWLLRSGTLLMIFFGSVASLPLVWQLADIAMALMAATNITALLLLSPVVKLIASDYLRQRRLGLTPVFDAARFPDIERQLEPGLWQRPPAD